MTRTFAYTLRSRDAGLRRCLSLFDPYNNDFAYITVINFSTIIGYGSSLDEAIADAYGEKITND
jgi:hypothetical protein